MTMKKTLAIKQPEIGQLISELRCITGLTQEQFAAALGATFSTINRWENGHSQPSPMAMTRIQEKLQELGDRGQELLAKYLSD